MRKTKIICTIGPASESEEKLRELMLAGMNVARFNFSHGSHKEQLVKYNRVLKVRKELGLPVATLLDTKGPEIRLRDFEGGKVELVSGQQFILTTNGSHQHRIRRFGIRDSFLCQRDSMDINGSSTH